jgi:hypothetical protein
MAIGIYYLETGNRQNTLHTIKDIGVFGYSIHDGNLAVFVNELSSFVQKWKEQSGD